MSMPDTSPPERHQPERAPDRVRLADHRPMLVVLALVLLAAGAFGTTRLADVALRYSTMRPLHEIAVPAGDDDAMTFDPERARETVGGMDIAAEALYLPPVVVLRVLSLGYQSAWADLLFVRAHAYFLTHFFSDRKFTWLDHYYEAIKGLDPDNPRLYQWAGQVVKFGQHINDGVITRANGYLEEGLQRFPNDWRLHMDLGFNLHFEMAGQSDAERALYKLRARDHFATAAGLPGAPIDPNFVAELFEQSQESGLAIAYGLQKYYESTPDQRVQLVRRIGSISSALADGIVAEERQWREHYAFLPVALYALLAERRSADAGLDEAHD
jgi:hypothetical protein